MAEKRESVTKARDDGHDFRVRFEKRALFYIDGLVMAHNVVCATVLKRIGKYIGPLSVLRQDHPDMLSPPPSDKNTRGVAVTSDDKFNDELPRRRRRVDARSISAQSAL